MKAIDDTTPALVEPTNLTTRYERAVYWLNEAARVDEVVSIRNEAEQLKVAGRQARDRSLTANAVELQLRSERRLGELLIKAKEAGQLGRGRIGKRNGSGAEPFQSGAGQAGQPQRVSLEEAGIDKKLSMKAQQLAAKAGPLFEQVIAEARAKIEAGKAIVVNPMKELNTAEKKVRRAVREAQLAARQKALPDKLYGVIYADPEWQFEVRSERGLDRAADNHYPTSDLATIKARPVGTLAAPDCVLFMWVTAPFHAAGHGVSVMRFWGFEPKAEFIWDKIEQATGYWNRNQHEVLLLGTKGSVPCPAPGTQYPSLISSRPGAHSEKPDWAYELIESYFPNLPKIELNARRLRPGWDAWGLEAPEPNPGGAGDIVGESDVGASRQHVGRSDGEQRSAAPVPGADGRREGQDANDQGQGRGAAESDRQRWLDARDGDRQDEDRGSRDVGGEGADGVAAATESQAKAGEGAATGENAVPADPAGRLDAGRTASATSEIMDATAGETASSPDQVVNDTGAAAAALEAAPVSPTFKSTPATDEIIRRHYAGEAVDFDALCAELGGATRLQARRRANQLGLGKRSRQLGAVLALPRDGGKFMKTEAAT